MPKVASIARYDAAEDVIFVDATGLDVQELDVVDAIFDELELLSAKFPNRYALVCFKDVQFGSQAVVEHYGTRTIAWQKNVKAVLRYAADDPILRAQIRTEAMKHQKSGMRSNLYEDRESAVAAVRAMKSIDARRR